MAEGITFEELLGYNEEENEKWRQWFAEHPATLEFRVDLTRSDTVRDTLLHIFACELWYAEMLLGKDDRERFKTIPQQTVEDLFAIAAEARAKFRSFFQCASEADWEAIVDFPEGPWGKLTPSKRKCFAHTMVHSIRHWAQLATALRKQGLTQEGWHDLLFTKAMA